MAFQAEIIGLAARKRLQHVIRVRRLVWIVAFDAVALRRRMHTTLADNSLPVFMALEAKGNNRCGLQFDSGDVTSNPNHMAGKTAAFDRRMHGVPLRLIFVALQATGSVRILLQRGGMLGSLKGYTAAGHP